MRFFSQLWDRLLAKLWYAQFKDIRHRRRIRQIMNLTLADRTARGVERIVRIVANIPGMWSRTIDLTPGGQCQWGKTLFVCDGEGDHYLVINSMTRCVPGSKDYLPRVRLPEPAPVWALHMEPAEYVRKLGYDDPAEHAQISRFYTSCESMLATAGIYAPAPPYVPFHLSKTWDALAAAKPRRKEIPLGIIMSGLRNIEGHHARFAFFEKLAQSGIEYAFWGRGKELQRFRGYRGFAFSKWNVHSACRYSIVLENSISPHYWSEKPADALLAWSLPIYHGCPNFGDYVPHESFISIDIRKPDEAIETIQRVLRDDPYEQRLAAIAEARRRMLHEHHLYAFIDRELEKRGRR
jgi:hypothetical protein